MKDINELISKYSAFFSEEEVENKDVKKTEDEQKMEDSIALVGPEGQAITLPESLLSGEVAELEVFDNEGNKLGVVRFEIMVEDVPTEIPTEDMPAEMSKVETKVEGISEELVSKVAEILKGFKEDFTTELSSIKNEINVMKKETPKSKVEQKENFSSKVSTPDSFDDEVFALLESKRNKK